MKEKTITISDTGISAWSLKHDPNYRDRVATTRKAGLVEVGETVRIILKNPEEGRFDMGLYRCVEAGPSDEWDWQRGRETYAFKRIKGEEAEP